MIQKNNFFNTLTELFPKRIWQIPLEKTGRWIWGGVCIWGIFLFYAGFSIIPLILSLLLAFFLLWITIIDIRWHIIPFPLIFLATLGLGIARWTIETHNSGWQILLELAIIAGIGMLISGLYFLFRGRKGWGWGDIFLLIMIGSSMGLTDTLISFLWAVLLGSAWGFSLWMKQQKRLTSPIPMAPFITIGVFITQIWGNQILSFFTQIVIFF